MQRAHAGTQTESLAGWSCVVTSARRDGLCVPDREEAAMRSSSSLVAPASVILSALLLWDLSGTAVAQTATATPLPGITVHAPKQAARQVRPREAATTTASRRTAAASLPTSPTAQKPTPQKPAAAPDSVLGKLAALEKASSSCADGCETSLKTRNAPWHGCSYSGGVNSNFSSTCTDTLKYKSYIDCRDTKLFLGWIQREAWWHCSGMAAGKRFQVAEARRRR